MKTNKTLDKEQKRFEEEFLEPTGVGGVRNNKFKKGVEPMHVHNFLLQSHKRVMEEVLEEIKVIIEKSRGNNYHNIGIGSLDYHEKCAVDAYIETLVHRLKSLKNTE